MGLVVVHGPSPTEGSYVMIPPWTAPEEVVYTLFHRNLSVRKRSGFPDMKRANKSRRAAAGCAELLANSSSTTGGIRKAEQTARWRHGPAATGDVFLDSARIPANSDFRHTFRRTCFSSDFVHKIPANLGKKCGKIY